MRAMVFVLAVLALTSQARAECGARLGEIVRNSKINVPVSQDVYKLAKNALRHYRSNLTQGGVYISSAIAYKDVARGKITGYRVDITDGGDESTVSYYFDNKSKLVYGKWNNQSPENFWFCEK